MTYRIIRFRQDEDHEVLVRGLTLEQAQAHCRRDDTQGDGWFDGYEREPDEPEHDPQPNVAAFRPRSRA